MTTFPESPAPGTPAKEDTTVALLAYITPIFFGIGIVVAIVMHNGRKTALGAYHLRQSLGLLLTALVLWIPGMIISLVPVINFIMFLLGPVIGLAFFVLWIMGLLSAINGQTKPLPVVGEHYQKLLANAFA